MNIQEERKLWEHNSLAVNTAVDQMVDILVKNEATSTSYMMVDRVYRAYLQWMHSAQNMRCDPEEARQAIINVMSVMLLEASSRMGCRDEHGNKLPTEDWILQFTQDLREAALEDHKQAQFIQIRQ